MAKPASAADDAPAPPKKRPRVAVAARQRRARARRAAAPRAPRANPSGGGWTGVLATAKTVGVGVGAYGGTRLLQRMAWTIVGKKKPAWAKHAHAAAGAAAFAATLFVGPRVKALDPFLDSIIMGAGVAAAQGVVAAYVPRYAWLLGDCKPEDLMPAARAPQLAEAAPSAAGSYDLLEEQLTAMEQGAAPRRSRAPIAQGLQTAAAAAGDDGIDDTLLEALDPGENIDDLYGGLFEDPIFAN